MELIDALKRGEWVYGFHPDVAADLLETEDKCHIFNSLLPSEKAGREAILRGLIGRLGTRFTIHSPFRCDLGYNISIGEDFTSNYGLTILDEVNVTIGDRVFIGPNVSIYTIIHSLDSAERAEGIMKARPVTIGNDVWIGGDVTVLPGVSIGDGSVIGAGSVVTRSMPAGTLAAGNPCRVLRPITDADKAGSAFRMK